MEEQTSERVWMRHPHQDMKLIFSDMLRDFCNFYIDFLSCGACMQACMHVCFKITQSCILGIKGMEVLKPCEKWFSIAGGYLKS